MRIFYAQSGGVTSVINATCAGLLKSAYDQQDCEVLIGLNGIHGALEENFISSKDLSLEDIELLSKTPGGSFGSCRYKVSEADYPRIIEFIKKHNIDIFTYHGGNDSMDTSRKIAILCEDNNLDTIVLGLPKTIDNDLFGTDNSPGFGSAAKYLNVSLQEASLDLNSMYRDSTKVFVMETMGRNVGWLSASCGLSQQGQSNYLLLVPERKYELDDIAEKIQRHVMQSGFCTVALSEGLQLPSGLSHDPDHQDAFGHYQLKGVGFEFSTWLKKQLKIKSHLAISDYLQRSAGHCLSKTDYDQAYALGQAVIERAQQKNASGKMLTIVRESSQPYKWSVGSIGLGQVATVEKQLPSDFLNDEHQITKKAVEYFEPLITGEVSQTWSKGLPVYWPHRLKKS